MQILKGALVAGPDQDEFFKGKNELMSDLLQNGIVSHIARYSCVYLKINLNLLDKRLEPKYTSVSLDRNAVFTAALAAALSVSESDKTEPVVESAELDLSIQAIILPITLFLHFF